MHKTHKIYIATAIVTAAIALFAASYQLIAPTAESKNVLLIGWDGVERSVLKKLFFDGELPYLEQLVREGSYADIDIKTGKTETKPGWTEILTGYRSETLEIYGNKDYKPIPAGYTIFERLEDFYGKDMIATAFITGKINNTGARGPHKICANCLTRDPVTFEKTGWWDEPSGAPVKNEGERKRVPSREGEPYFHTKNALDVYESGLGSGDKVGTRALELLEQFKDRKFFFFLHFEEPDEPGHIYGGDSPEYAEGIRSDDFWLGEIVAKLKKLGLYEKTLIYVASDHGFDPGGHEHRDQPETFFATNDPKKIQTLGTRLDITPSILDRLEFPVQTISPSLHGKSLYAN